MALKMTLFLKVLLCITILRSTTHGTELKYPFVKEASSFSEEQENHHYDYIVVGGGSAGCPLATTLSQNFSVLLLERGGSPYGNINISSMQNFHISLADTSPGSPAQGFVSTDGVINARARVLGGGSCINAGFYTRASPAYVEEAGWEGELVNQSYPWIEEQIVQWPKLAPWQVALRDGLLEAGVSPFNGYTYDHVSGTKVGGTIFDRNGFRRTAADLLAGANPANLRVLLHATVEKIVFCLSRRVGRKPIAVGVIFKDENGVEHQASMRKSRHSEVILSAGSIGSPQLLLLSGIGPKEDLKEMNIPVIIEQELVGKGMSDNPMNSIFIPTKKPVEQSLIQTVGITTMGSYIEASSGFGQSSDSIHCDHGIMSAEIGQLSTLPPKQRSPQAIAAYSLNKGSLPREAFMGGFILEKVVGPLSTGHLRLQSADVDDSPSVTFNYFKEPEDLRRCVNGIRMIEKIVRTQHITDLTEDDEYTMDRLLNMSIQANINLIPKHTNDTASLEQFCRDTVTTIWHYHGGCQVGKVVDSDYRVMGVDNLRVVDGSTFIDSPGTNPQATVMMLGRYMGVKVLRERLGKEAAV